MSAGQERQELRLKLQRLRKQSGLSSRELARRAGVSQSKISRIEAGNSLPDATQMTRLAEALELSFEVAGGMISAARRLQVSGRVPSAKEGRCNAFTQKDLQIAENDAAETLSFSNLGFGGLLQTPQYAYEVLRRWPRPGVEPRKVIVTRLERQARLHSTGTQHRILIARSALYRTFMGQQSWLQQLDHIQDQMRLPSMSVGIVDTGTESNVLTLSLVSRLLDNWLFLDESVYHCSTTSSPARIAEAKSAFELLAKQAIWDGLCRQGDRRGQGVEPKPRGAAGGGGLIRRPPERIALTRGGVRPQQSRRYANRPFARHGWIVGQVALHH